MTRNTRRYWTQKTFWSRENCSFIRLNDAIRRTLLKAAPKNSKTIHYESRVQSNTRADFKLTYGENYGKLRGTSFFVVEEGGGVRCIIIASEKLIKVYLLQPIRFRLNNKKKLWDKKTTTTTKKTKTKTKTKTCSTTRLSQKVYKRDL